MSDHARPDLRVPDSGEGPPGFMPLVWAFLAWTAMGTVALKIVMWMDRVRPKRKR